MIQARMVVVRTDRITIDGTEYLVDTGFAGGTNGFDVAFYNEML